jgi:hypothetical protein
VCSGKNYRFGEPLLVGFFGGVDDFDGDLDGDDDPDGVGDEVPVPVGVGVGDGVTDGFGAGPSFSAAATAA